jgi:hypothetical protein
MNPDTQMTSLELVAMMAYANLQEGEAVIKLGGRWIVCGIKELNVRTIAGFVPDIDFKGFVK